MQAGSRPGCGRIGAGWEWEVCRRKFQCQALACRGDLGPERIALGIVLAATRKHAATGAGAERQPGHLRSQRLRQRKQRSDASVAGEPVIAAQQFVGALAREDDFVARLMTGAVQHVNRNGSRRSLWRLHPAYYFRPVREVAQRETERLMVCV